MSLPTDRPGNGSSQAVYRASPCRRSGTSGRVSARPRDHRSTRTKTDPFRHGCARCRRATGSSWTYPQWCSRWSSSRRSSLLRPPWRGSRSGPRVGAVTASVSGLALLAVALCLRSASAYICHEADRQFHGCGGRAPAGGAPGDTPWDGERVRWLTPRPRWTRWPPLLPRRGSRRTTRSTPRRTDLWRRPPHTSSSQTRAASLWGDVSPHPAAARPSSGFPEG